MEGLTNMFVRKIEGKGNLKAIASITWHGLVVRGIKVLEGTNGLFLGMPSRQRPDNKEYEDIAFFISKEDRDGVSTAIFEEYEKQLTATEPAEGETAAAT